MEDAMCSTDAQSVNYANGRAYAGNCGPGLLPRGESRRSALAMVLGGTRYAQVSTDEIRAACDAVDAFVKEG